MLMFFVDRFFHLAQGRQCAQVNCCRAATIGKAARKRDATVWSLHTPPAREGTILGVPDASLTRTDPLEDGMPPPAFLREATSWIELSREVA